MTNFHESDRLAPEGEKRVALVDIDETICKTPADRDYSKSKAIEKRIKHKDGYLHYSEYINNIIHGKLIIWFPGGNKKREQEYINGKLIKEKDHDEQERNNKI